MPYAINLEKQALPQVDDLCTCMACAMRSRCSSSLAPCLLQLLAAAASAHRAACAVPSTLSVASQCHTSSCASHAGGSMRLPFQWLRRLL